MFYKEFINNILLSRGRIIKEKNVYYETHHILPKCMGCSNKKDNLIQLYPKEHFLAHKMLAMENPNNFSLVHAYQCMAFTKNKNQKQRYELTPEEYEEVRILFSNSLKNKYKDKTQHPNYGKHLSNETKEKISKANKGNKKCLGRKLSDETKEKISKANKNPSQKTRQKMSNSQKARNLTGKNNPRAKKIIRISDGKIYDTIKQAALENNINYSTFKNKIQNNKYSNFKYYKG